jgi:hypothetical protein
MAFSDLEKLWQIEARSPEGAVKCFLVAAYEWFGNKNPDGRKMYGLCLSKKYQNEDGSAADGFFQSQFGKPAGGPSSCSKAPIPASYLGGTPANHYRPDYNFQVKRSDWTHTHENTDLEDKFFIQSGGKDFASPVLLKKNGSGFWKIIEYSSLYTGIKTDEDLTDF